MTQELLLRPAVGMRQYVGVPYVVALGVCDALPHARIAWPHNVVHGQTGEPVASVRVRAGYDDEGMFARVALEYCEGEGQREDEGEDASTAAGNDLASRVEAAVRARVDAWARGPQVAPLAPVLADYAEKLALLGKVVEVVYPNGRLHAKGTFVGVDVWGRATVRLSNGNELEFPPEKYQLKR